MKKLLKGIMRKTAGPLINQLELSMGNKFVHDEQVAQKQLWQHYRTVATPGQGRMPSFSEVGFRKYSQFEEDGILLMIFAALGPINRTCVEICAGNGRECMSANLIINHGWWGHLFDGNEHSVEAGKEFFSKSADTFFHPPNFTKAWITAENVNDLIRESGAKGPVDLLSLDMDGMDYWIWKAIDVIEPRVVVCETHNGIPHDQPLTAPYDPKFEFQNEDFRGASLAAMNKLAQAKGYRLVGTHRFGFNAFFIKKGFGEELFPEVAVSECLNDPASCKIREEKWPIVQKFKWITV